MYGIGGTAYVYFVYGMYHQFNVVTNVKTCRTRCWCARSSRSKDWTSFAVAGAAGLNMKLTSGPGRLCLALRIDADWIRPTCWAIESGSKQAFFNLSATDRARAAHRN